MVRTERMRAKKTTAKKRLQKQDTATATDQRWSVRKKQEVVLRLLRGEPLDAVSREVAVEPGRLEAWRDRALDGMLSGLKARQGDPLHDELLTVKAKLGEALIENELLRERTGRTGPFGIRRWKK